LAEVFDFEPDTPQVITHRRRYIAYVEEVDDVRVQDGQRKILSPRTSSPQRNV
jgi:hypothetical protein